MNIELHSAKELFETNESIPSGTVWALDEVYNTDKDLSVENFFCAYASSDASSDDRRNDPDIATDIMEAYNLIGEDVDFEVDAYEHALNMTPEQFAGVIILQDRFDCGLNRAVQIIEEFDPLYACPEVRGEALDFFSDEYEPEELRLKLEDEGHYFSDKYWGELLFTRSLYEGGVLC